MKLDAFDYSLPVEKIATKPADPRESARLLECEQVTVRILRTTNSVNSSNCTKNAFGGGKSIFTCIYTDIPYIKIL